MSKSFHLPTGEEVIVDDDDFERVCAMSWYRVPSGRDAGIYVGTSVKSETTINGRTTLLLHRMLMDAPKGMEVDHKDGNRMNNRRENLRIMTGIQNARSFKRKAHGKSSKFRGVYLFKRDAVWRANIRAKISGKNTLFHLGCFDLEIDAARAYNAKATELGFSPEALNAL